MAKARKLKVFRTPIGFHDAYVAAPSQKAALEAWGTDSNLFAAGVAELVTDPRLTKEPLASPGEVVRKLRGSADEQIQALGKTRKKTARVPGESVANKKVARGRRPSSAAVDMAEKALGQAESRHRQELAELKAEEQALARRRRELERRHRAERERLGRALDQARARYRSAMEKWGG